MDVPDKGGSDPESPLDELLDTELALDDEALDSELDTELETELDTALDEELELFGSAGTGESSSLLQPESAIISINPHGNHFEDDRALDARAVETFSTDSMKSLARPQYEQKLKAQPTMNV